MERLPCWVYNGDIGGVDIGVADRMMGSGGEPDMIATLLSMSSARRLVCELAIVFRLALDVVMDGSVAAALSNLGRLPPVLGDESLLDTRRGSGVAEPDAMLLWGVKVWPTEVLISVVVLRNLGSSHGMDSVGNYLEMSLRERDV